MMLRALTAGFLLWHPGFTEATAYKALVILAILNMGIEVLKAWADSGGAAAAMLALFGMFVAIIMWHQTWLSHHTVLSINFWISMSLLGLVAVLRLTVKPYARTYSRTQSRHQRAF